MNNLIKIKGKYSDIKNEINNIETYIQIEDRYFDCAYLYIIELDNNRLKVGYSGDIESRVKSYSKNCFLYANKKLLNICILGPFKEIRSAEQDLIRLLIDSKKFNLFYGDEWFLGSFEEAAEIANNQLQHAIPNYEQEYNKLFNF